MEFLKRAVPVHSGAVALLPGAWNPPTRAHMAMAAAALDWAVETVLVLPRELPHKEFEGPDFTERARWIERLAESARISAAVTDGGLFIEMARECRAAAGAARVFVVCGRDAAERIVNWDYGAGDSIERQLEEYEMLVAPRGGPYVPPARLAARVHALALGNEWQEVSSSEVRGRMRRGEAWTHLVPEPILDAVRRAYTS